MKKKQKAKTKSKSQAKDAADKWFSLYIRMKDADFGGYNRCYTCSKVAHYKELQCGHFISRASNVLRFDPDNARVQCVGCNVFKHGNYIKYTRKLIKEKGEEFVDYLEKKGKQTHQFTLKELLDIGADFKKRVEKLK